MIRHWGGMIWVLLGLLVVTPVAGAAKVAAGPRLSLTLLNEMRPEVVTTDPSGSDQQVIVDGQGPVQPFPVSPSSWSADGSKLAFIGARPEGEFQLDIYVQAVDGDGVSLVPGTHDGTHPVLSPDGHTVAFSRYRAGRAGKKQKEPTGFAVWIADLNGGVVRRITPYRRHISDVASAFSPDGSTLLLTRTEGVRAPAVVSVDLSRGLPTIIARRAADPVFSPDGSQIAFVRVPWQTTQQGGSTRRLFTDLYLMKADGSGIKRLTKTAKSAEAIPSWDPSGDRLAYLESEESIGEGDFPYVAGGLAEINADGTCRTEIFTTPEPRIAGAAWRPGPGRGAGPISC